MGTAERVWLVERTYSDKGLVTLVYATPDGDRHVQKQRSEQMLTRSAVTAATEVDPDRLEPTSEEDRDRFAAEATRMQERHDPADEV